jgi:hypothetical protein
MSEGFAHVAREYLTTVVIGASYAHRENIRYIMCHFIEYVEVITECLVCNVGIRREIDENFIRIVPNADEIGGFENSGISPNQPSWAFRKMIFVEHAEHRAIISAPKGMSVSSVMPQST